MFVDLTKAFDIVSRDVLWKIMSKFSCPSGFIAMMQRFHDSMQARVQNDEELSEPLGQTGLCFMAPILFSMMFSAMLISGGEMPNWVSLT